VAERGDLTFQYALSPRVATVASPSTELVVQDWVDTARADEDELLNLENRSLISASGKEDLTGGVFVGITCTNQDTVVAFETRTAFASEGTVTTPDAGGTDLIDSAATFITDAVAIGAQVTNYTDEASIATVLRVVSQTQLLTTQLGGGSDNQYDTSDGYKVRNVVQCRVSGGNLVAVDKLGTSISPILPTAGTQIILANSSSATTQEIADIQQAAFNDQVTIDQANTTGRAVSGTAYPIGTLRQPVDNLVDAQAIAVERGFERIYVLGTLNLTSGDWSDYHFIGHCFTMVSIAVSDAANVAGAEFRDATLSGALDGNNVLKHARLNGITGFDGLAEWCILADATTKLSGNAPAFFNDCRSGVAGMGTHVIDCNVSGSALNIRGLIGGVTLINKTGSDKASCDILSGHLKLADTVTIQSYGDIVLRGSGSRLTNEAVNPENLSDETFTNPETVTDAVWDEPLTGASHNLPTSAGRRLRLAQTATAIHEGVLQGATASTAQLDTGANAVDNFYEHAYVVIIDGTGAGQSRAIQTYVGSSRTANVVPDWIVTPDAASEFIIYPFIEVHAFEVHEPVDISAQAVTDVWVRDLSSRSNFTTEAGGMLNLIRKVAGNAQDVDTSVSPSKLRIYADGEDLGGAEEFAVDVLDADGDDVTAFPGHPYKRRRIA
jgi:hypothetical protein